MKELNLKRQLLRPPERFPPIELDQAQIIVAQLPQPLRQFPRRLGVGLRGECSGALAQGGEIERALRGRGQSGPDEPETENPRAKSEALHFSRKNPRCLSETGSAVRSMTFNRSSQIMRFDRFDWLRRM